MTNKFRFILQIFLISLFNSGYCQQYFVSPTGSDTNSGTSVGSPFKTILRAKNEVRNHNQNMTSDIIVNLMGGTYKLTEALNFGPLDSGTVNHFVIYKAYNGQTPIISSGRNITGWTQFDTALNIWKADIQTLYARQVYTGDQKAIRARSRTTDGFNLFESVNGYFSFCNTLNYFNWNLNTIQTRDIEMVANNEWKSHRVPIQTKCLSQFKVEDSIFHYNHLGQFLCGTRPNWIENAYQLLDEPNEWYIDRSGASNILYYKSPTPGQPQNIIVPELDKLIVGDGVDNLIFDGLIFEHATWNIPSDYSALLDSNRGFAIEQADWLIDVEASVNAGSEIAKLVPGAITFTNSEYITLRNNTFRHLGSTGLLFDKGCHKNLICNNIFTDISGSGICIGNNEQNASLSTENSITNNLIENIANEYMGSIGIFVMAAQNTTIEYNELRNFPYSGISVGWGWGKIEGFNTLANKITHNKIDCTLQSMNDTGAIYMLGKQGKCDMITTTLQTEMHDNYIINFNRRYGAIYFDQGSSFINSHDNVVENNVGGSANWSVISDSLTYGIKLYNNYYSPGYMTIPVQNNVCSETIVGSHIVQNNTAISSSNTAIVTSIKNAAGRIASTNCNPIAFSVTPLQPTVTKNSTPSKTKKL